jgi:hypothetical protein
MKAMQVHLKYWKLGSRSGIVQAGKSGTKYIEIESCGHSGPSRILKPRLRFRSRIKEM